MYTVQQAIGIPFGINKRWQTIDLTQYTMAALYATFRRVQISLLPQGGTVTVFLDIQDIAPQYATSTLKFSQVLTSLGDASLPTKATGWVINQRKATFRDALRAGYRVNPVNSNNVVDTSIPTQQLPNIRLTKTAADVDYGFMLNHCLISVNGYYHITDTDGLNGLMVKDAMKSLVLANQDQVGILSFSQMCSLTSVPVTPSMVDHTNEDTPIVTLSQNLTNKTVALVLGGYLQFLDGSLLSQVGASSFKIDFKQIDIVNRYYESLNYIDLSSLGIVKPTANSVEVAVADLTTTSAVAGWLGLSQTFFVIFDTPSLYIERKYVSRSGLPNAYFNYSQPNEPLVMSLGRHPSYWVTYEDNQWRMSLYNNVVPNALYYSTDLHTTVYTSGAQMPGTVGNLDKAYLLEIGRDY